MIHTSTEKPALTTAQECADYATSLRSAAMAVKLEGRAPPASFLRAAELFERAATELNLKLARVQELEAQTAHMADLVELADYATKKLEASQAQRVPLSDSALLARIRKEIDRAIINDHKTEPVFGKRTGEPCVKIAHLEATIAGWEVDCGIKQEKQG